MKIKKKSQTQDQIEYIFRQPIYYPSCATVVYMQNAPERFEILAISPDRGGSATTYTIIFSSWGDENKRVLGIKTKSREEAVIKEDIYEYDRNKLLIRIFPRGLYQKINPLYVNTHHQKESR